MRRFRGYMGGQSRHPLVILGDPQMAVPGFTKWQSIGLVARTGGEFPPGGRSGHNWSFGHR